MKMPALLVAAVALSACATTTSTPTSTSSAAGQSAETPLKPSESLDIAQAPAAEAQKAAPAQKIEPAKAVVRTQNAARSGDAVCNLGALDETHNFIICEDGALRKAGVVEALSAPHDPDLKIEDVAKKYEVPPQIFSGIQSATYGTLINGNRQAPRKNGKHKAQTGLVQIQGKVYEVYQLSANGKTGTIFVEQRTGS